MSEPLKKGCFKCGQQKPVDDFYRHPQMGDGRLGKCKECTKRDVSTNYAAKRDRYSQYEHDRNKSQSRREKRLQYQRNHRRKFPEKDKARRMVARAVKSGKLLRPNFCGCCGRFGQVQAHHTDYSKPLDVIWVCFVCHREHEHGQVVTAKDFACDLANIRN